MILFTIQDLGKLAPVKKTEVRYFDEKPLKSSNEDSGECSKIPNIFQINCFVLIMTLFCNMIHS